MSPLFLMMVVITLSLGAINFAVAKAEKSGTAPAERLTGWRKNVLQAGNVLFIGGGATALFFSGITKGLLLWNEGVAIGLSAFAISLVLTIVAIRRPRAP